jgi:hypothetical protein
MLSILLVLALPLAPQAMSAIDASKLALSPPASITEIDARKLKGELFRLAWSTDAQELYLQTIERDKTGNIKEAHHYFMKLDGKPPAAADGEPPWAAAYWAWKSTQAAPGRPGFRIEVEQAFRQVKGMSVPMGGDLARGGTEGSGAASGGVGIAAGDAMSAALQSQKVNVYTLRLKGEVVGEFSNTPAIPGLTFGWGPAGSNVIAFTNPEGHIVLMDEQGRKQQIASSSSALLPAWTDDGKKLAYLERPAKNRIILKIVDVILGQ